MAVMAETPPRPVEALPFTVDDLDAMPDDGYRRELLDGVLIVSPAPVWAHQEVVRMLAVVVDAALPPDLRVVHAPFEWRASQKSMLQPDILVARYEALVAVPGSRYLEEPPLLAVEVLSPTTRRIDRLSKLSAYQDAGVRAFWMVDPDPDTPSITVMELVDGRYSKAANIPADGEWKAEQPFPVTLRPADLVRRLKP